MVGATVAGEGREADSASVPAHIEGHPRRPIVDDGTPWQQHICPENTVHRGDTHLFEVSHDMGEVDEREGAAPQAQRAKSQGSDVGFIATLGWHGPNGESVTRRRKQTEEDGSVAIEHSTTGTGIDEKPGGMSVDRSLHHRAGSPQEPERTPWPPQVWSG